MDQSEGADNRGPIRRHQAVGPSREDRAERAVPRGPIKEAVPRGLIRVADPGEPSGRKIQVGWSEETEPRGVESRGSV